MIQEVEKSPKVALCRACYGTGKNKESCRISLLDLWKEAKRNR